MWVQVTSPAPGMLWGLACTLLPLHSKSTVVGSGDLASMLLPLDRQPAGARSSDSTGAWDALGPYLCAFAPQQKTAVVDQVTLPAPGMPWGRTCTGFPCEEPPCPTSCQEAGLKASSMWHTLASGLPTSQARGPRCGCALIALWAQSLLTVEHVSIRAANLTGKGCTLWGLVLQVTCWAQSLVNVEHISRPAKLVAEAGTSWPCLRSPAGPHRVARRCST